MPRKPRIISSSGIYHIVLRSINQHIIFEEDADYQKFLFCLSDCKRIFDIDIYAYCLMDNHVHLLLRSSAENLASFFQSFGARFVLWYNKKYSRSGHLFQDRFFSVDIQDESQFLATLAYIHNNPVKAGISRYPSEYRWSSFNAFYGKKDPFVDTDAACRIVGSRQLILSYFASVDNQPDETGKCTDVPASRHFIPDEEALSIFKSVTHMTNLSSVVNLTKLQRNDYIRTLYRQGLTQKQIARIMDVSVSTVKRAVR